MEVSGLVSRQIPYFPGAGITYSRPTKPSLFSGELNFPASHEFEAKASLRITTRKKGRGFDLNCGFSDNGHVAYYYDSGPRCGGGDDDKKMMKKKENEIKKKLKLLRGLESLGGAQVQTKLISEGAEALLRQLEQVRAEEKEKKKKKKKEEEKAKRMKMKDCESSSSSSSELSGSECGEVIDMGGKGVATQQVVDGYSQVSSQEAVALWTQTSSETAVGVSTSCGSIESIGHENASTTSSVVEEASVVRKIEVCMGKKCKASGGVELMEEFKRLMGVEGSVVGCKCLGKCKNGPNVRVLNSINGIKPEEGPEDSVRNPTNPLYIGVGLEDVSLIVANLMKEEVRKDLGI